MILSIISSTPYASADIKHADTRVRLGPRAEEATVHEDELDLLADLVLPISDNDTKQLLQNALVRAGPVPESPSLVNVLCVRWALFPGRHESGKLWADAKVHGLARYTLDQELLHHAPFKGTIVQLDRLLCVDDVVLAKVTYGKKCGVEPNTKCHIYSFSEVDQPRSQHKPRIILAQRLKTFVHFALVRGSLVLNRFYISP